MARNTNDNSRPPGGARHGGRPFRGKKLRTSLPRPERSVSAPTPTPKSGERIAKVMARAGLCSRREAEEWIAAGRVAVNGETVPSPARDVLASDTITIDGKPLPARERTRLFLYHKPRGLVTTTTDPQGRPTVFDALPKHLPRLVSVGRLDVGSEGLLLLTNDGGLARVLELPETGWLRRYRVRAHGQVTQVQLDSLRNGVEVEGVQYGPIEAELDREQGANVWITVSLREGKNREVRNVLGHLGLQVNRLIRVSYGPFQLGELAEGEVEEVRTRALREQLGERVEQLAGVDFAAPRIERKAEPPAPREEPRPPRQRDERPPRHRDERPRHRDDRPPRDRGDRPPRSRDDRPPRNRDERPPRHRDDRPPRDRGDRPPRSRDDHPPRNRDERPSRHRDDRPPRDRDDRPPRNRDERPPRQREDRPYREGRRDFGGQRERPERAEEAERPRRPFQQRKGSGHVWRERPDRAERSEGGKPWRKKREGEGRAEAAPQTRHGLLTDRKGRRILVERKGAPAPPKARSPKRPPRNPDRPRPRKGR